MNIEEVEATVRKMLEEERARGMKLVKNIGVLFEGKELVGRCVACVVVDWSTDSGYSDAMAEKFGITTENSDHLIQGWDADPGAEPKSEWFALGQRLALDFAPEEVDSKVLG